MSQIVVDTDVASIGTRWHSSTPMPCVDLKLFLSFMSIAELRMGAFSAGWGSRRCQLLERFMRGLNWCTRITTCARSGLGFVPMRGRPVDQ